MLRLIRPSHELLRGLLDAQRDLGFTYDEVGATASEPFPMGYGQLRLERRLGQGDETWDRAVAELKGWAPQRDSGLIVEADGPVAPGVVVAMAARLPVGYALAVCRVVYVEETPGHYAFGYGTLPDHPACGEERFELTQADGAVTFVVSAFSRPHHPLARLGAPVTRALQTRATTRYLDAMENAVH